MINVRNKPYFVNWKIST